MEVLNKLATEGGGDFDYPLIIGDRDAVDIDIYLNNELSDLTLQVEILYSGKVSIEDLHDL